MNMPSASWKKRLKRLPANIVSNRLWLLWGGSLYIRSRKILTELSMRGPEFYTSLEGARAFVKWSALARRRQTPLTRVGLFPTELGMFGNMIRRITNACLLAQVMKVGHLVIPPAVIFSRGLLSEGHSISRTGLEVWFGSWPQSMENTIDILISRNFFNPLPGLQESEEKSLSDAWGSVRDLLVPQVPERSSGSKVLTIHVRSGDVFGPRKPPRYGQPPFSYYQIILQSKQWASVVLVYQDLNNPVVQVIIDYCAAKNIPLLTRSGELGNDLSALLGAEILVAGRGTFAPAIAGLSPHCRTVYYFEDKMNVIPAKPGLRKIRVRDHAGDYRRQVLSKNWENSASQRELMVTYPSSSLTIDSAQS